MKRTIFLVDMNAFYIACETTRNSDLVGVPAAVAGDPQRRTGIILTANYEARKCGVKTAMVLYKALKLCPDMKLVPPDHKFYSHKSKEVMNILSRYTPIVEQNSVDEAWLDMTGCEGIFGKPLETAQQIMDSIYKELGLWCSIGISENKFLSKMASNMKKPMGITALWKKDLDHKLWPLPIKAMQGVGRQTAKKLIDMDINTIGDLANSPSSLLIAKLGKRGDELHKLANGIDDSPVVTHSEDSMKSIGRSITLPENIKDFETARIILMKLAEEVGTTARKHSKKGRTVQITLKYSNFQVITRQTTVPATNLTKEIITAGVQLLKENWSNRSVRLLGISLSGFDGDCHMDQISMFDQPIANTSGKEENLEKTIDKIREKYGSNKIKRGTLMDK